MKMRHISAFKQFLTVTYFELYRHLVRKRVYIMTIILALVIVLPTTVKILLNVPNPEDPKEFIPGELGFIDILIILGATFFAGDSIVSEYEKRTGYVLFPNPVKREIIYFGKIVASLIITTIFILVYYVSAFVKTIYYYNTLPYEAWVSLGYALLYTLAVIGFAYLISSIFKGTLSATLVTFFMLFMIFPIFSNILSLSAIEPWFILTYTADIITLVFNPPAERVVKMEVSGFTFYIFYPDFTTSVLVMLAYAIVTILISLLWFKFKELKE